MQGQYLTESIPAGGSFVPNAPLGPNGIFSYTDNPEQYLQNPYGTMVRPVLNVNYLQAELNPNVPHPIPQTISIPADNLRIISSQVLRLDGHWPQQGIFLSKEDGGSQAIKINLVLHMAYIIHSLAQI